MTSTSRQAGNATIEPQVRCVCPDPEPKIS